jgi:hypothetical protein
MAKEPDYLSLAERFASLAARTSDPSLSQSYTRLAQTYRALDFWQERFRQGYEPITDGASDPGAPRPDRESR